MAYEWTEGMGNVSPDRAFEPHYRAAIIAATTELERIASAHQELPLFSWGKFSTPKNGTAKAMASLVEKAIAAADDTSPVKPEGSRRAVISSLAVRAAYMVRSAGFGENGWALLASVLAPPRSGQAPAEVR